MTKVEDPFTKLPVEIQNMRLWALNQFEYYAGNHNPFLFDEKAGMAKFRMSHPNFLGNKPLIVLTANEYNNHANVPDEIERRKNQTAMKDLSFNSKQVIVQSGHHIHVERPEEIIKAIKEIINSHQSGRNVIED